METHRLSQQALENTFKVLRRVIPKGVARVETHRPLPKREALAEGKSCMKIKRGVFTCESSGSEPGDMSAEENDLPPTSTRTPEPTIPAASAQALTPSQTMQFKWWFVAGAIADKCISKVAGNPLVSITEANSTVTTAREEFNALSVWSYQC